VLSSHGSVYGYVMRAPHVRKLQNTVQIWQYQASTTIMYRKKEIPCVHWIT